MVKDKVPRDPFGFKQLVYLNGHSVKTAFQEVFCQIKKLYDIYLHLVYT